MRRLFLILLLLFLPVTLQATAYNYDVGFYPADISFSQPINHLVENQPIRLYASIHNYGSEDVAASVKFFNGPTLIGQTQLISVRANGLADEVYVDWQVPQGAFNIRAIIIGQDPNDENPANDETISPLITPLADADGDGIPDIEDFDNDNDGLTSDQENQLGTSDFDSDSDDDGVSDSQDAYPTDATKTEPQVENVEDAVENEVLADVEPVEESAQQVRDDSNGQQNIFHVEENEEEEEEIEYDLEQYKDLQKLPGFDLLSTVEIQVEQKSWNEFDFYFNTNVADIDSDSLIFEWDFGDGQKVKENQKHKFKRAGTYFVKLKVLGPLDNTISDTVAINIPFWSVSNVMMWALVIFLVISLLGLIFAGNQREQKDKNKE